MTMRTYMRGLRICAVCRLMRTGRLPMGRQLALTALVRKHFAEVRKSG